MYSVAGEWKCMWSIPVCPFLTEDKGWIRVEYQIAITRDAGREKPLLSAALTHFSFLYKGATRPAGYTWVCHPQGNLFLPWYQSKHRLARQVGLLMRHLPGDSSHNISYFVFQSRHHGSQRRPPVNKPDCLDSFSARNVSFFSTVFFFFFTK